MPTSDFHNISSIVALIYQLHPASVLDIGCGFGKYGVLIREYLDVWNERLAPETWRINLEGIEACEGYRSPIFDYVYSKVHYGEAQTVLPTLDKFDVVLIADVIEHLEKKDARKLVEECFARSPVVIVSTPLEFCEQRDLLGNTYEVHRSWWRREDFPPAIHVRTIRMISCNIFVASREPLDESVMALTDPADFVYLRSRRKLGSFGLPLSLALKGLCRLLS